MAMAVLFTSFSFPEAENLRPRRPEIVPISVNLSGGLHAWEFEKGGRELRVRVEGRLVFNTATTAVSAALAGDGLAFVPEDRVRAHPVGRRVLTILQDLRRRARATTPRCCSLKPWNGWPCGRS